ncbi:MAG: glycosyltransferase family 2 protein [Candidatus Hydrothermales bacterium]
MNFSIIVVNFNSGNYLTYTLRSIKLNILNKEDDFEVIVVDNSSTDGSLEKAQKIFPEFKYIKSQKNLGYGGGCNLGAELSKGKILIFSNADIVIPQGTFDKIRWYFEKEKKLGILGAKLEYPDGTYQPSCRRYPRFKYLLFGRKSIGSFILKNNPITREFLYLDLEKEKKACEVEAVLGAFMAIKREVFESVGGFDEEFFLFAEDIDLCLRVKKRGYKVLYAPDIKIIHFHGGSRKYLGPKSEHYLRKSIFKFFKKHNSINTLSRLILYLGLVASTSYSSAFSIFHTNKN